MHSRAHAYVNTYRHAESITLPRSISSHPHTLTAISSPGCDRVVSETFCFAARWTNLRAVHNTVILWSQGLFFKSCLSVTRFNSLHLWLLLRYIWSRCDWIHVKHILWWDATEHAVLETFSNSNTSYVLMWRLIMPASDDSIIMMSVRCNKFSVLVGT